jgi:hypothetical protein
MKFIEDIKELKKGDTVIVKNCSTFISLGFNFITGDIFNIERGNTNFVIRCKETNSFEKISIDDGLIFYIC